MIVEKKIYLKERLENKFEACLVSWMSYVEYVEMEPSDGFMTKLLNI